jgi:ParB family chromosome partitioning protein
MPNGKRVLGRGLADLLPVGGDGADSGAKLGPGQEVSIVSVHRNPRQPRTRFDEASLAELTDSIRANGILQPLLVRPRPSGGYEIVAGERRYRAALAAGLKQVPIVVRNLTDEETLALALIENLIREDIGPLETARAFQRLMDDFGWTQEEMGRRVGKSRSAVANSLRLLRLPEPIQQSLERGELMEGHARTLLGEDRQSQDPTFRDRQMRVFRQIRERGLSVREVERLMRGEKAQERRRERTLLAANAKIDHIELSHIEDRIRTALAMEIQVVGTVERGQVVIKFSSADELDSLISRLEAKPEPELFPTPVGPAAPRPKRGNDRIQGLLSSRPPLG